MGKYNVDDIFRELGIDDPAPSPVRRPPPPAAPPSVATASDDDPPDAGDVSPLPTAPANQQLFGRPKPPEPPPQASHRSRGTSDSDAPAGNSPGNMALSDIFRPEALTLPQHAALDLGELLVAAGVVSPEKLTTAEKVVKSSPGKRIADVLIEQGADEPAVRQCEAKAAGLPFERVALDKGLDGGFDGKMIQRLGLDFCKQHQVLPLRVEGARVVVGAVRTDDVFLLDDIRQRLNIASVKLVIVPAYDVRGALEILGAGEANEQQPDISELLDGVSDTDVQVDASKTKETQVNDLEAAAGESPVIRYVNFIIQKAAADGASDIHIEPAEKKLKVRFRIDGELYEAMNPPPSMGAAITSRLKIMANLDISERRLPQDGRIRCMVQGRKLDLRVSTLPTPAGEKTVMRILDTKSINVDLNNLGFHEDTLTIWKKVIDAPHGVALVTGPTGSGKTTTLYASLRTLDKNSMNISTVEDPVEYHLDGLTQTQTHEKIGMTFAVALRALLRQDPDVIMVGEIRDHETALIAVQAALTGHLVLSTLHTNDAPSSITRLVNIGLEPFLVGAAVNAVVAQRLIRRLCKECKAQEPPDDELGQHLALQGLDPEFIWTAKGCDRCRKTGYSGRVGIYELLAVDDQLRDTIARNPNVAEFRRLCIERGMVTLRQDGMRKVAAGVTTVHEVLRVTEANV
ncbi:MAG: ATPase, T2SS/T4P/T4SS family [Planctomycetota bacterium]|nr:ATPase, T2SS/T4P/T4SS family [Planctomycetota bacterium]